MAEALKLSKSYIAQVETGAKEGGPKLLRSIEAMEKSPLPGEHFEKIKGHFSDLLKRLQKEDGWTADDIADVLQMPVAEAESLLNGSRTATSELWKRVEESFEKTRPRGDIMRDVKFEPLRYIPVISWAQAGQFVDFEELPTDWQDRIPTNVKDPKAVAVEIRGDSMEPYFRAGDRVILLPSQEPQNGDIVVAKFKNDGIALKLYHDKNEGRVVNLASYNTLYPPQDYERTASEWIIPCDSVVKKLRH